MFDLMEEHAEEYAELLEPENEEKRTELKSAYKQWKDMQAHLVRIGQRSKAQTLSLGIKNLEAQV